MVTEQMDTLKEALAVLLAASVDRSYIVQDDVIYTRYVHEGHEDVINFDRREGGDLNRQDVDWTRAVLTELGYETTGEWLPVQGMSWLSNGISAGVSFSIRKLAGAK